MRKKVIEIYQSGKGYKAISKAVGLPQTTVRAILQWRKHGTVENLPRSGWPTKITPRAQRQLIQEVTKDPTTTSKELQASLASVKPCQNGAICLDGIDVYHCFCVPGFQGYNCEIDINECASQPCENNGKCINGKDHYICECLIGFTGVNCDVEINECEETPCQNGATCHDYVGQYICECVSGFEGISCEMDINECISVPCLNNGSCIDLVNRYECDCSGTGFAGSFCEEEILECSSEPCQHGATCHDGINQYTCQCWPGYEGNNCEMDVDECEAQPCENGGMCFQRSDQRHYGVMAQLGPSFSYEYADGFLCKCLAGFMGFICEVDIDECKSAPCKNGALSEPTQRIRLDKGRPCLNGGDCMIKWNDFICSCPQNYTGKTCDIRVWCASSPCVIGSQCVDLPDGYECLANATFENNALKFRASGSLSAPVTVVSVKLRTRTENGTLLRTANGLEFFHMGLLNSFILVKICNSINQEVLAFYSEVEVSDGEWHHVELRKTGWQGENCQDDINECIYEPCIHGTCKNLPGEYLCQCALGYRGKHCDEDVDECHELHCENTGSCVNSVGGYTCICPPAYSGPLCQCEMEIDECESNPCLNGATCMDQQTQYICECLPGFSGDKCEAPRQQQRESIPWLVVAVPMICFATLLVVVGLGCMMLTARRKRQSEGTYSPSQQEVAGARLEMGSVLKVPPEERLI
ncbi:hypothetical protein QTP86_005497 [Hemibagrus guttatus]|nr:hypothetical protein QTP86_005497 [Hemibagrus guttatus]